MLALFLVALGSVLGAAVLIIPSVPWNLGYVTLACYLAIPFALYYELKTTRRQCDAMFFDNYS